MTIPKLIRKAGFSRRRTIRLKRINEVTTTDGSNNDVQQARPQTMPEKIFHARFGVSSICQRSYSAVSPIAISARINDWWRGRPHAVAQIKAGRAAEPIKNTTRPARLNSRERNNIQKKTSPAQRAGETSAPAQSSGCRVNSVSGA